MYCYDQNLGQHAVPTYEHFDMFQQQPGMCMQRSQCPNVFHHRDWLHFHSLTTYSFEALLNEFSPGQIVNRLPHGHSVTNKNKLGLMFDRYEKWSSQNNIKLKRIFPKAFALPE